MATILIVDDHEVVRQGVRSILGARPEWEVIGEATNGRDAIEAAKTHRPDVVILDISMPVMNGLDMHQQVVHEFSRRAPKTLLGEWHNFEV